MIDKRLAVIAGLAMVCGFCMNQIIRRVYPLEARFPYNLSAPVLALELAHNAEDISTVLPGPNYRPSARERAIKCNFPDGTLEGRLEDRTLCPPWDSEAHTAVFWNTLLDLAFIPLYVLYLLLLSRTISDARGFRNLILIFAVAAGIFDYIEDGFIFAALQGHKLPIYRPSLAKWVCLGLALTAVAFRLMGQHRKLFSISTDRLLGLEYLIAGGSILAGVVLGHWWGYGLIQAGVYVWAILVSVTGLYWPILCLRRLLKPNRVRFIDDFCNPNKPLAPEAQAVREVPLS